MKLKKRLVLCTIAVIGIVVGLGSTSIAYTHEDDRPSERQIAFAQQVSDLFLNELLAALFEAFDGE